MRKVRLGKVESLPKAYLAAETRTRTSPHIHASEPVPFTPELCCLPRCLAHPGAETAPVARSAVVVGS